MLPYFLRTAPVAGERRPLHLASTSDSLGSPPDDACGSRGALLLGACMRPLQTSPSSWSSWPAVCGRGQGSPYSVGRALLTGRVEFSLLPFSLRGGPGGDPWVLFEVLLVVSSRGPARGLRGAGGQGRRWAVLGGLRWGRGWRIGVLDGATPTPGSACGTAWR